MALGFTPIILAIILSRWLPEWSATLMGAVAGIAYTLYSHFIMKSSLPRLILYGCTAILLLVGLVMVFVPEGPFIDTYYLLILEFIVLLLPAHILLTRKQEPFFRMINNLPVEKNYIRGPLIESFLSTNVTSRIVLLCAAAQVVIIAVFLIAFSPLSERHIYWLFRFSPLAVFTLALLFNQMALSSFNTMLDKFSVVPIVNDNGDVVGKTSALNLIDEKADYRVPVLRVAFSYEDKLYVREITCGEETEVDLPIANPLCYGQNLKDGVQRLLKPLDDNHFHYQPPELIGQYLYENDFMKQLNYLFLVRLDDNAFEGKSGFKLWSAKQIEMNLHKDYFSPEFEQEYELLKTKIFITEKEN
jgi:hypothetical protein